MAEFLVELYVPRGADTVVADDTVRARVVAEELARAGRPVRHVRSLFVPEEETCFHLYEAADAEDVAEAARRAGLRFDSVAEAISSPSASDGDDQDERPMQDERRVLRRSAGRSRPRPSPTRPKGEHE